MNDKMKEFSNKLFFYIGPAIGLLTFIVVKQFCADLSDYKFLLLAIGMVPTFFGATSTILYLIYTENNKAKTSPAADGYATLSIVLFISLILIVAFVRAHAVIFIVMALMTYLCEIIMFNAFIARNKKKFLYLRILYSFSLLIVVLASAAHIAKPFFLFGLIPFLYLAFPIARSVVSSGLLLSLPFLHEFGLKFALFAPLMLYQAFDPLVVEMLGESAYANFLIASKLSVGLITFLYSYAQFNVYFSQNRKLVEFHDMLLRYIPFLIIIGVVMSNYSFGTEFGGPLVLMSIFALMQNIISYKLRCGFEFKSSFRQFFYVMLFFASYYGLMRIVLNFEGMVFGVICIALATSLYIYTVLTFSNCSFVINDVNSNERTFISPLMLNEELRDVTECPICKSSDMETLGVRKVSDPKCDMDVAILKCSSCGCWSSSPIPSQEALNRLYSQGSLAVIGLDWEKQANETIAAGSMKTNGYSHTDWIVDLAGPEKSGHYLEIGPGDFVLSNRFKEKGYVVYSVEPSPFGRCAQNCYARMDDLPANVYFDVVVLHDVLEHVSNPLGALEGVLCRTKPGGHVYLGFPNCDSIKARLLWTRWGAVAPFGHLHYFSSKSIDYLAEKTGTDVKYRSKREMIEISLEGLKRAMSPRNHENGKRGAQRLKGGAKWLTKLLLHLLGGGDQWMVVLMKRQ